MEITVEEINELLKDPSLMLEFTQKFNSVTSSNANSEDLWNAMNENSCRINFLSDMNIIYRRHVLKKMNYPYYFADDEAMKELYEVFQNGIKKILEMKPDLAHAGNRTKAARF